MALKHPTHRMVGSLCSLVVLWAGAGYPLAVGAAELPRNVRLVLQDVGEAQGAAPGPAAAVAMAPAPAAPKAASPARVAGPHHDLADPARPEVTGTGLITAGWLLVGVGLIAAAVFGQVAVAVHESNQGAGRCGIYGNSADTVGCAIPDSPGYTNAAYASAGLAVVGLTIAIGGHISYSESEKQQRLWDEKHATSGDPPTEPGSAYAGLRLHHTASPAAVVAPFVGRDGAMGLALGGRF